jgi:DNA-binding MarR family transcriptional regulator
MSNPKNLTVAQLLVLTAAAQRPDHLILPLPAKLRVRGGARRTLLAALLKMNFIEEFPIDDASLAGRSGGRRNS